MRLRVRERGSRPGELRPVLGLLLRPVLTLLRPVLTLLRPVLTLQRPVLGLLQRPVLSLLLRPVLELLLRRVLGLLLRPVLGLLERPVLGLLLRPVLSLLQRPVLGLLQRPILELLLRPVLTLLQRDCRACRQRVATVFVGWALACASMAAPARAASTPISSDTCRGVIAGVAVDGATGAPVADAVIRLGRAPGSDSDTANSLGTDARGRFVFPRLCPGPVLLEAEHVAYGPQSLVVDVPASAGTPTAGGPDTLRVRIALVSKVFRMDEIDVRAETVTPLAGIERASQSLPLAASQAFVSGDLVDAIALVPGVLVTDGRPYIRGLGQEHVTPTIDGVVARDPVTGTWILPPQQSIDGAEVIGSAMIAESTPSIGGLFAMHLASGTEQLRTRLVYGSDRLGSVPASARDTDTFTLSSSGPTEIAGLRFSAAYRGSATNGPLSFDRSLPHQMFAGLVDLGNRMSAEEAVSLKFSWRPGTDAQSREGTELTAAVVSTRSKAKVYRHHYSRSGWVGYAREFDRYTDFVEGDPVPGRDVYYEGPAHLPVDDARSTLVLAGASHRLGSRILADARIFYGDHELETRPPGPRLGNEEEIFAWWRDAVTRSNHQESDFYAVYGDFPDFSSSRSREAGLNLTGSVRIADQHRARIGISATLGRHRVLQAAPIPVYYIGSSRDALGALETSAYVEETWLSDDRSWMRISLRHLARTVSFRGIKNSAGRWAPGLAFHQPMTAADAINVEVGQSYQFAALSAVVPPRGVDAPVPQVVQRVRFVEIGFQHHFSRKVVGYLGVDDRQYVDVQFGSIKPTVEEELTGSRNPLGGGVETRQLQMALDYQISATLVGQSSLIWSKTTADSPAGETLEVPWSRRVTAQSWFTWRAPQEFSATMIASVTSGRPYDLCLLGRDCASWQRIRGTLPAVAHFDFAGGWRRRFGGYAVEVSLEIRNLLGLDTPEYGFSAYPMTITSDNFLAYWDATGDTNGYLVDTGNGARLTEIDNPETRVAGRSAIVAVGVSF